MTEYELGNKKFTLRNVCGKNLKVCKEFGLLNSGNAFSQEELDLIKDALENGGEAQTWKAIELMKRNPKIDEMEIYLNPEKLIKLIDAVFLVNPEDLKELEKTADELNVGVVINGVFDFLKKCQPSSLRQEELLTTLINSAMKTANSQI
jgi:hypothetical protein